jgi:hypothetical protein
MLVRMAAALVLLGLSLVLPLCLAVGFGLTGG